MAAQMLAACENALWEVWVVAPNVEKLALYVTQYAPPLMPLLASLGKKHAQQATASK